MSVDKSLRRRQEARLFKLYYTRGDTAAREELIRRWLPFAHQLAHRYAQGGEPADDLMQVAALGLIKSIDRFDPTRGYAFSTYAVPSILGELRRHFRDNGWAAHVPRDTQERALKVASVAQRLTAELARSPSPQELSECTGETVEHVLEALDANRAHRSLSLDAPLGDEEGAGSYADSVGQDDGELDRVEYRGMLKRGLRTLPERDRRVVALRFEGEMSQSEIAQSMGLSQMHVSRILRRSLDRVRVVASA
jgi:RNA polymerase sigma-B factor